MSARVRLILTALVAVFVLPLPAAAQTVLQRPAQSLSLPKGTSLLLVNPASISRFTVGDPEIAEVVVVSPTELLINGKGLGSTSLIVWEAGAGPKLYSLEVTIDTPALERYLAEALPGEQIQVKASGNSVTLAGDVKDPVSVDRAVEIAKGTGVEAVVNNLVAPPAVQVLLQVRFAEITRSNLKDFSTALSTLNPQDLSSDGDWLGETISDGLLRVLLSNPNANIEAIINASITKGVLRSLAEPNLLTLPGKEASFLAGGEFPYPTVQSVSGGAGVGGAGAVTITFREFGVRLKFTPDIMQSGAIRLKVAPEVSTLDFANGLTVQGFEVPSILVRRAETEVELKEGQYLALAGLIDNSTIESVSKIPILGDIPILGAFFKSTNTRARQTELLVFVT
ncbi:MAG TPA: pilus assembly protein N-terminal domain-containing protein, partial [Gemmatimonadales bacterium]|nr:pilus assembly protein N-terminal domain-containing protein [Gemmatimonadales bacterium]